MKKNQEGKRIEKGQVLPIVVIMLFAILAMAALLLDGGVMMMDRRQAQAAADAGALAGAKELCNNAAISTVVSTAQNYAILNKASSATAVVNNAQVNVSVAMTGSSFFARILGYDTLNTGATASAGCFLPSQGKGVLPVAWNCRAAAGEPGEPKVCSIHTLDWSTQMVPLISGPSQTLTIYNYSDPSNPIMVTAPLDFSKFTANQNTDYSKYIVPKYLYVIMDSEDLSSDLALSCSTGSLDCTLGGAFSGGDRGWLDLNGMGGGTSELIQWINGTGYPYYIHEHTWIPDASGDKTSVFQAVEALTGHVVLMPVFDATCDQDPSIKTICETSIHNPVPPEETVVPQNGATTWFHIGGFSDFYISCVSSGGQNKCPGAQISIDAVGSNLPGNTKSIEGYFISDYPQDIGNPGTGGSVDAGLRIISLTK